MSSDFIRKLDCFLRKIMIKSTIIIATIVSIIFFFVNNKALITFAEYLEKGNDSINTMVSIFTGIYFSLFILMLSLPAFSRIKLGLE